MDAPTLVYTPTQAHNAHIDVLANANTQAQTNTQMRTHIFLLPHTARSSLRLMSTVFLSILSADKDPNDLSLLIELSLYNAAKPSQL